MNDRHFELLTEMDRKLTALGTHMKTIIGNGQPGRLGIAEQELKDHSSMLNRLWGGIITLGSLFGLIEYFIHKK